MTSLITVNGVRGFIDNQGVVQLNLEDTARGLGFTDNSKGTQYVRWNTVRAYLNEFGFSQEVAKGTFIPENIFYRLAMRAKNEVAEEFQIKVADEILPTIRRTGQYSIQALDTDTAIAFALRKTADMMVQLPQIESRLERIENNTTIDYGQQLTIKKAASKAVTEALGGWKSEACRDKGLRSRAYAELWRNYKDYFNINSYHNTLIKEFDKALSHIDSWKPTGGLLREIENTNRQMAFMEG